MLKVVEIVELKGYTLICKFNNGQLRMLSVDQLMKDEPNKKFVDTILDKENFQNVQIGSRGQILWPASATMKNELGMDVVCDYDMSGDFIYHYSTAMV